MFRFFRLGLGLLAGCFRSHRTLLLENLALRQQLTVLKRRHPKPKLSPLDKLFWVSARRFWSAWKSSLIIVTPETVVRSSSNNSSEDLVFQSVKNGSPIRDNNILCRFIKPAARALDIGWVNWRCLRTSHATWLKLAGADVKDAQAQMRHSRASTTLDIYQQFVPECQQRVVEKLSTLAPRRIM